MTYYQIPATSKVKKIKDIVYYYDNDNIPLFLLTSL